MQAKLIGSILLILGTSVGAGMLALPLVTAHDHFLFTACLLFIAWLLMTMGAIGMLEVNLWLPAGSNMLTMAQFTFGRWGKYLTWVIYLLLLYCLICAYLSGLSDLLIGLSGHIGLHLPSWLAVIFSLLLFGGIVYRGIGTVDWVNRGLMLIKLSAYACLVLLTSQHVHWSYLAEGSHHYQQSTMMVMLTSYGYAIIIPSLRSYLDSDKRSLKRVVWIGSLLPLVIYLLWVFTIQGLITKTGANGLIAISQSSNTNSMLIQAISHMIDQAWIADIGVLFVSICAVTSFLGVSVCLIDFITDGLQHTTLGRSKWMATSLSYGPPLLIVLLSPGIFIHALNYAGICCLLLLVLLPLAMLYQGRYRLQQMHHLLLPSSRWFVLLWFVLGIVCLAGNFI